MLDIRIPVNIAKLSSSLQLSKTWTRVGFTFLSNNNNNNNNDNKNPHLDFLKGTVLENEEQGVGMRDKGQGSKDKE